MTPRERVQNRYQWPTSANIFEACPILGSESGDPSNLGH